MIPLPRVNQILKHTLFKEYTAKNARAEEKRMFCRHGLDHGLAVARIAYIYLLEKKYLFKERNSDEDNLILSKEIPILTKEIIYAAAILHDLGRWVEYEQGEDHACAGAELVQPILADCGFNHEESEMIVQGIREHRRNPEEDLSLLGKALAFADDWARDCRSCPSQAACYKYTPVMDEIVS